MDCSPFCSDQLVSSCRAVMIVDVITYYNHPKRPVVNFKSSRTRRHYISEQRRIQLLSIVLLLFLNIPQFHPPLPHYASGFPSFVED